MTTFECVYLARHGQTVWNLEGRRQGRLDSPLTPEGVAQVRRNAETMRAEAADTLYCSPLGRARASAAVFAEVLGLPVRVVDELAEVDHGELSGLTRDETRAARPGFEQARNQDKYRWRFPGGESYQDADARAARALTRIARSGARRPLLVSHEMIGRMLLKNLTELDSAGALKLNHPPNLVYRVRSGRGEIETLPTGRAMARHVPAVDPGGTRTQPSASPSRTLPNTCPGACVREVLGD